MDQILVATDFSEWSRRAELRAAMLCQDLGGAAVELCTVKETGLSNILAQAIGISEAAAEATIKQTTMHELEARSAKLQGIDGVRFSHAIRFGSPAQEIINRAEEIGAGLILAGAHGSNCLMDLFLGNTADKLIHLTKRPLLIVKNDAVQPYRHVLVPIDFSPDSSCAARLAMEIAPAATLTFLHAFDVPFEGLMHYANVSKEHIDAYRARAHQQARTLLDKFIADLGAEDRYFARSIVYGSPALAVRKHAEQMKPDLIVMGKHGRSWFEELLVGSVTRDTLDQTASDVLVASSRYCPTSRADNA